VGGPSFAAQHLVAKWKPIKQSAMMLAKALKVSVEELVDEFISEDDLKTFDGWLRYQAVDASATPSEELANWQHIFEDVRQRRAVNPKVGLMKLQPVPGEFKYAVAVGEGADLWLVLWVRRSAKGEVFVMKPMGDRDWNPHTSYHLDGTLHVKSHGRKMLTPQKRQPLTGSFQGTVDLGIDAGYAPKAVGAIYDPTAFSGVVKVPSGVLGPKYGAVGVVLVEPGHAPPDYTWGYEVVTQMVFRDVSPHVVITVLRQKPLHA
jgi:hypothetical protein